MKHNAVQSAAFWFSHFTHVQLVGRCSFNAGVEGDWLLSCWYSPFGGLEPTRLWVNKRLRGRGIGFTVMRDLCKWADAHREILRIWALPFDGESTPSGFDVYRLATYYARSHGYEPQFSDMREGVRRIRMIRYPNATARHN